MIEIDQKLVHVTKDGVAITAFAEMQGELATSVKISYEDLVRAIRAFAEKIDKPYASAVLRQAASMISTLRGQIK